MKRIRLFIVVLIAITAILAANAAAQSIPSPEEFYGFRMGADGELVQWDKVVEYFNLLADRSDRIIVQNLGESTEGNPFILAIISSPDNLKNLEKYREISKKLADPRGLSDREIQDLIKNGKFVGVVSNSIHASEVGGINGSSEQAYEMVTSSDPTNTMILDNVIYLMIPSFNPDGAKMIADWFYQYKGTPYNNTRLPYLYHLYTGHDNNRDAYMLTQVESQYFAKVVFRDWMPQAYIDHHHMGSNSARFYIPPYLDPIHTNVSPLLYREHQLYGAHIAVALENAGKSGFESGAPYTAWWQAAFCMVGNFHNITSMLTESASVNWADPIYILPDQLGGTRGRPEYKAQMTMPRLWPGGWWHFREIVEQQMVAAKAMLEVGARYRETLLGNMVRKAQENIKLGQNEPPYAFIIPRDQHDFLTAVKLVKIFQMNGVEVHHLDKAYKYGSYIFAPGSYVVSTAQPKRVFVKSFLEQINYPDNTWTRSHEDNSPIRPYDMAAYALNEHMGVDAIPIMEPLQNISVSVAKPFVSPPKGTVEGSGNGYILDHRSNDSIKAMNRLLAKGYDVSWIKEGFTHENRVYTPGAILVKGGGSLNSDLQALADELGLSFQGAPSGMTGGTIALKTPRLGMYKRFAGGNADEGWTNWLLQDFDFTFTSLFNKDMKAPSLAKNYDVIIFPDDSVSTIIEGRGGRGGGQQSDADIPEEYRGGIGEAGVENLKTFVKNGGTLITFNGSYEF
ncbi:MAG: peptidase M14 family protein, partial [Candidatus Aminicenantes bacterium]|nr:peptidase M14 family protein [Candidatus Aminicenantes bacterium]